MSCIIYFILIIVLFYVLSLKVELLMVKYNPKHEKS